MPVKEKCYALRLLPGADLKASIQNFAIDKNVHAGWIITCAGSLTQYSVRFANQQMTSVANGFFEIINLSGTLSVNGVHLHISVADNEGKMIGGHLMNGCLINTTAEIILVKSGKYIFRREKDESTLFKELQIIKK